MKARDSQRSKVYKSESEWEKTVQGNCRFSDIHEVEAFVRKVCDSSWTRNRFGTHSIKVKDGRGTFYARGGGWGFVNLPVWARTKAIILHEICHCLSPSSSVHATHGWRFCQTFLLVVQHFMGLESSLELKKCFKKNRVKFHPPRKKCLGRKGNAEALKRWREEQKMKKLCQGVIDG